MEKSIAEAYFKAKNQLKQYVSVTVRFEPTMSHTQEDLRARLVVAVEKLERLGFIEQTEVETVFPKDEKASKFHGTYVVRCFGDAIHVLSVLRQVSGVDTAYPAAGREDY